VLSVELELGAKWVRGSFVLFALEQVEARQHQQRGFCPFSRSAGAGRRSITSVLTPLAEAAVAIAAIAAISVLSSGQAR